MDAWDPPSPAVAELIRRGVALLLETPAELYAEVDAAIAIVLAGLAGGGRCTRSAGPATGSEAPATGPAAGDGRGVMPGP